MFEPDAKMPAQSRSLKQTRLRGIEPHLHSRGPNRKRPLTPTKKGVVQRSHFMQCDVAIRLYLRGNTRPEKTPIA